jgi:hypothetical protein
VPATAVIGRLQAEEADGVHSRRLYGLARDSPFSGVPECPIFVSIGRMTTCVDR